MAFEKKRLADKKGSPHNRSAKGTLNAGKFIPPFGRVFMRVHSCNTAGCSRMSGLCALPMAPALEDIRNGIPFR